MLNSELKLSEIERKLLPPQSSTQQVAKPSFGRRFISAFPSSSSSSGPAPSRGGQIVGSGGRTPTQRLSLDENRGASPRLSRERGRSVTSAGNRETSGVPRASSEPRAIAARSPSPPTRGQIDQYLMAIHNRADALDRPGIFGRRKDEGLAMVKATVRLLQMSDTNDIFYKSQLAAAILGRLADLPTEQASVGKW